MSLALTFELRESTAANDRKDENPEGYKGITKIDLYVAEVGHICENNNIQISCTLNSVLFKMRKTL